jgi:hypothetical protein
LFFSRGRESMIGWDWKGLSKINDDKFFFCVIISQNNVLGSKTKSDLGQHQCDSSNFGVFVVCWRLWLDEMITFCTTCNDVLILERQYFDFSVYLNTH